MLPTDRPQRSASRAAGQGARDDRPDARDPRLVWAQLTKHHRERPFANQIARRLADWAAAILTEETLATWAAAHPDVDSVLSIDGAP